MLRPLARRRGSMLIILAVVVFVFMSASLTLASAQVMHARRLDAERGKLQATYAAESGVFAAFDADRAISRTVLLQTGSDEIAYTVTRDAAQPPCWYTATGTASVKGASYTATVRGYVVGRQIVQWDFQ